MLNCLIRGKLWILIGMGAVVNWEDGENEKMSLQTGELKTNCLLSDLDELEVFSSDRKPCKGKGETRSFRTTESFFDNLLCQSKSAERGCLICCCQIVIYEKMSGCYLCRLNENCSIIQSSSACPQESVPRCVGFVLDSLVKSSNHLILNPI